MDKYTASNGATITTSDYGSFKTAIIKTVDNEVNLAGVHVDALREFFRAEEDERLGRWRWPENPDYVVYPNATEDHLRAFGEGLDCVVLRESDGGMKGYVRREDDRARTAITWTYAARAYFDAHPESKPWHGAKPGEAWKLTANGDTGPFVTMLTPSGAVHFIAGNGTEFIAEASDITDGRRIWPEES